MYNHKRATITKSNKIGDVLPHRIYKNGKLQAGFTSPAVADQYKYQLEHHENISCCTESQNSNGWYHSPDCPNWVPSE